MKERQFRISFVLVVAVAVGLSILIVTSVAAASSSLQLLEAKLWPAEAANSISLTPQNASNVIGSQHELTATIGVTKA